MATTYVTTETYDAYQNAKAAYKETKAAYKQAKAAYKAASAAALCAEDATFAADVAAYRKTLSENTDERYEAYITACNSAVAFCVATKAYNEDKAEKDLAKAKAEAENAYYGR